jgi:response regulator RpfG family c-di-GMP phosphodiesterase
MGEITETRSKETGNHVKRVAEYSMLLALKYELSEQEAEVIRLASPMHDVGKVGIPDAILNKPGPLTEEEFEVIKTHATLGYEMLKHSNKKVLNAAAIIAQQHHEKYDGSGYPNGLKGDNIHIYGRITAVADVFDALCSDRVYKKAWKMDRVLDFLQSEKGLHFDPDIVDLFLSNLDEFLVIKEKYA